MKYKIISNYKKFNGNIYYAGKKVKINVDKLINESTSCKIVNCDSYKNYIESLRDKLFTINFLKYNCVILNDFIHMLDIEDLLPIEN